MTRHALAAAAALALLCGGSAIAQNTPQMSEYTVENVTVDDPFGEIEVDVAGLQQAEALANFAQTLTEEQREELMKRCDVIKTNADAGYSEDTVAFCKMFSP